MKKMIVGSGVLCSLMTLLIGCVSFSSAALAEAVEDAQPSIAPRLQRPTREQQFDWLAEVENTHRVEWLEGEKRFFALYAEERTGQAKGAVVLIPPAGQYAGWSSLLAKLHNYLPDYGWYSLAITLPPVQKKAPAEAVVDNSQEEAPEGDSEIADDQLAAETPTLSSLAAEQAGDNKNPITSRLQAAINFLNQQGQYNIVLIGSGTGALYAAEFIASQDTDLAEKGGSVRALVLIDAVNEAANTEEKLPSLLGKQTLPILDIYQESSSNLLIQAKQRKQQLKKLPPALYQQLEISLSLPVGNSQYDTSTRRIRGWLDRYISGRELVGGS